MTLKLETKEIDLETYVDFLNYYCWATLSKGNTVLDDDGNKDLINLPINSNSIYMNEDVLSTAEPNPPKKELRERNYICPICKERFKVKKIHGHFANEHKIVLETEILESDSYEDFLVWKKDIENKTKSHFNRKSIFVNNNDMFVCKFYCHRSGYYKPKSRNSNKINSYCPASLKVTHYANGRCVIHFTTTHVGHTDDLEYTKNEKRKQKREKNDFISDDGKLQTVSIATNVYNGTSLNCTTDSEDTSMIKTNCDETKSSSHNGVCSKALGLGDVSATNCNLNSTQLLPCPVCGKVFRNQLNNLKRHVIKVHPNETSLIQSLHKRNTYTCEECSKSFHNKIKYRCHLRSKHLGPIEYKCTCPICKEGFGISLILPHFEEAHDIKLETEQLEAETYEDFLMWKEDMERSTQSQFNKKFKGSSKRKDRMIHYFYCHRSGNSRGKSLQFRGSMKINSYCPASLKVVLNNDGRCFITYQKTHVGHAKDVEHLRLTRSEKEMLARKIAANIPFETILREVRKSYTGDTLSPLHLLTRRHLDNLKKKLHLYIKSDCVYIFPTNTEHPNMKNTGEKNTISNLDSDISVSPITSVSLKSFIATDAIQVPPCD